MKQKKPAILSSQLFFVKVFSLKAEGRVTNAFLDCFFLEIDLKLLFLLNIFIIYFNLFLSLNFFLIFYNNIFKIKKKYF